jgi:DNA-binding response OmpR family regulator
VSNLKALASFAHGPTENLTLCSFFSHKQDTELTLYCAPKSESDNEPWCPQAGAELAWAGCKSRRQLGSRVLQAMWSDCDMSNLILVVECEAERRKATRQCLEQAGYSVRSLSSRAVLDEAHQVRASLILIDAAQRNSLGVDLCRRIRQNHFLNRVPVVLLAGTAEENRIRGLEAGADDCIADPLNSRELVARVQSLLRRAPRPAAAGAASGPTDIVIDRAAMKLSVRGNEVATTTLEFRLLDYLALHRGRVFTRDVLLDAVWGEMQFVTPRTVDTCVRRVRDKIEPDRARPTYLKTVRGVGYRFDAVATWPES